MDNNPLSILRAQVDAATPGEWVRLHDSQQPVELPIDGILPDGKRVVLGVQRHGHACDCGQIWSLAVDWPVALCDTREGFEGPIGETRMANAALIVTAVAITRRMVSDEAIEQAARVQKALRFRLYNADDGEEGFDLSGQEIEVICLKAALSSLLTGGV